MNINIKKTNALNIKKDQRIKKAFSQKNISSSFEENISSHSNSIENKKPIAIGDELYSFILTNPHKISNSFISNLTEQQLQSINARNQISEISKYHKTLSLLIKQTLPLKSTKNIQLGTAFIKYLGLENRILNELAKDSSRKTILNMVVNNDFNLGPSGNFAKPILRFISSEKGLRDILLKSLRVESIKNKMLEDKVISDPLEFSKYLLFLSKQTPKIEDEILLVNYTRSLIKALTSKGFIIK